MGSERLGGHLIALFTACTPADTHPNATIKLNKAFAELSLVFSFTCRMFYCNSAEVLSCEMKKEKKKEFIAYCQLPPGKTNTFSHCDLLTNCLILGNSGLAFQRWVKLFA